VSPRAERPIDRRKFLALAGATGLAVAGPLALAERAGAGRTRPLKVGVLLPTDSSYVHMNRSLLSGLKLGLRETRRATFAIRQVERGYGGAYGAATELFDDGVDVVVAGVSAPVAALIAPLAEERRRPLVVANAGAHVVLPESRSPYVLHNSLHLWQGSFALGTWAASVLGRRALLAAAQCDAGYDMLYSFRRGFGAAGGMIVNTVVTHEEPEDDGLADLFETIGRSGADFVYGGYSGAQAVDFVRGYAASGLSGRVPLTGTAFMVEDYLLPAHARRALGVTTAASWTASRRTPANAAFTHSFRKATGRPADPFAALGYDTGLLIVSGLSQARTRGLSSRRLVEALRGTSIESPRGRLSVERKTNTVTVSVAIRRVRRTASGLANVERRWRRTVPAFPGRLAPLASDQASGYVNEYLCA
jgi:branched-chain amino acid transport system substrate-binding protein